MMHAELRQCSALHLMGLFQMHCLFIRTFPERTSLVVRISIAGYKDWLGCLEIGESPGSLVVRLRWRLSTTPCLNTPAAQLQCILMQYCTGLLLYSNHLRLQSCLSSHTVVVLLTHCLSLKWHLKWITLIHFKCLLLYISCWPSNHPSCYSLTSALPYFSVLIILYVVKSSVHKVLFFCFWKINSLPV